MELRGCPPLHSSPKIPTFAPKFLAALDYKVYSQLDLTETAREILHFWKEEKIFEKSIENRDGAAPFVFFEGPPSANGMPGIHHALSRALKDIFCRYKTLQGYQVRRKSGWDTHGLPVELQVEKRLGLKKEDIGTKISVAEYNEECRKDVMKFTDVWENLTDKLGYWIDQKNPYITYEKNYIESLWSLLKRLYDKDLLYKGYTIQPFSPAAGTGLSSHELNQPGTYRPVKDTTCVAQFKITGTENDYFLAWTTTPWTLPSNTALAVGEDITYVKVATINPYTYGHVNVILAKNVFADFFAVSKGITGKDLKPGDHHHISEESKVECGNFVQTLDAEKLAAQHAPFSQGDILPEPRFDLGDFTKIKPSEEILKAKLSFQQKIDHWYIVEEVKGKELTGIRFEQLMPYVQPEGDAFKVIVGDFVTTEEGTGIVHIAPTFGADDMRVAQKNNIPALTVPDPANPNKQVPLVDRQGRFVSQVTDFAGRAVKDFWEEPDYKSVDVDIVIKLKNEGKAFRSEKYEHTYPHCWRTDKPILYYPLEAWFIRTTAYKDRMIELNNTINWKPASTGTGRFGNWLENMVDWNLSRSRFWGTPLPLWMTEDGSETKCIGSIAELKEEVEKSIGAGLMESNLSDDFDLHRPYVDDIILVAKDGRPMRRTPDVVDVWFDSGAMPYAQWHFPFENKETFDKSFPADFIAEGVDQTRGWFFTLHALGVMLFDSIAYKNVVSNGLILDKNGVKMSKRLGNIIDPFNTLEMYGADATRWYMAYNTPPWDNMKFDVEGIDEVRKKFFGTLHNVYSFFALYANIDKFTYSEDHIQVSKRPEIDRWIMSLLQSLIIDVEASMDDYEPTKAARSIHEFVIENLSNWYVRLCRRRFWKGEYTEDKISAYQTLYECLVTVSQLAASIAPFYTDQLFRDLNKVTGINKAQSVHLSDWPIADKSAIDKDLEERMAMAQDASSLVLSLRKKHKIRVRQPLKRIMIPVLDPKMQHQIEAIKDLILSEVNVKELEFLTDTTGVMTKKIKPDFKKLGPKFGPKMKEAQKAISDMGQKEILELETNQVYHLVIGDMDYPITLDDVEILSEDIPGWLVASSGKLSVALDISLSLELINEGTARELVNRIQQLRKSKGFEVMDHISVQIKPDLAISEAVNQFKDYICTEILADDLSFDTEGKIQDWESIEIDENTFFITIEKL
jgi:isoleucyl-tRNA synthetase